MRRFVPVLSLCLALAVTLALAGVTVDYDKEADLTKYKTYAWKEGTPAQNPLNEERVHKAVEAALQKHGLAKVEGAQPDLYVFTHVSSKGSQQVHIDSFGYGGYYGWGGWGPWGPTTSVNVQNVVEGMLIVDLVDSATNKLAWRGVATKTMFPDTKPEKIEKLINKSVADMFYDYPPTPKKKKS